ncbi:hypothetical protein [Streptomyces sp. AS02]|uniref:hypothetical protein n=1 Tax=Streptomyces sp. AS02 TaxID=2938946 RepID=UPI00202115DA|nr:hypothetical protein [Streptomyces sp. AS02]MCL8016554.1 hypothetical protein [Streptomyces sp. AS02]
MELSEHPLFRELSTLNLPPTDYVVAGSGPLLAHGLRREISDLDIVARGEAWRIALKVADPVATPSGHGRMVLLFDGGIEVFDRWLPGSREPDEMIEGAEWVQGFPFCPLREVLAWKERLGRQKDQEDVKLIRNHLRHPGV